ncbi:MAG: hypothetical protein MUF01_16000 [Bryobacterales bacterium]|jgi:hypothetical protein|nr:hypothetical protein [Bryobacterales bacterium]
MRAQSPFSGRSCLALLLVAVLGFLAIALFSPLHQHSADGSCSLNGIEFVVQAECHAGVPATALSPLAWREPPTFPIFRSTEKPSSLLLRGPPTLA